MIDITDIPRDPIWKSPVESSNLSRVNNLEIEVEWLKTQITMLQNEIAKLKGAIK